MAASEGEGFLAGKLSLDLRSEMRRDTLTPQSATETQPPSDQSPPEPAQWGRGETKSLQATSAHFTSVKYWAKDERGCGNVSRGSDGLSGRTYPNGNLMKFQYGSHLLVTHLLVSVLVTRVDTGA